MKVTKFVVSHSVETFRAGDKSSTFVSMNVDLDIPIDIDEFPLVQLEASERAFRSCMYNALSKGQLSKDEVKGRIESNKQNMEMISSAIKKKISSVKLQDGKTKTE